MEETKDNVTFPDCEQTKTLLKNSCEYGKYIFEREEKRAQGLIIQSGLLLIAVAILSNSFEGVATIPASISLALSAFACWRFNYKTFICGDEYMTAIKERINEYPKQLQYDY